MAEGNGLLNRHRAKSLVAGSNPALSAISHFVRAADGSGLPILIESAEYPQVSHAPVAQWIEHQTTDLGATGSSPVGRASYLKPFKESFD